MLPIIAREYKVMLAPRLFAEPKRAVAELWQEVCQLTRGLPADAEGEFAPPKKRFISFLDTPNFTLLRGGFVLRRRTSKDGDRTQYTLKCRSLDRYVAAGADVRAAPALQGETKFEEDIAAPFLPRFAHSTTVAFEGGAAPPFGPRPRTLAEAGTLFPGLRALRHDRLVCPPETPLETVNQVEAYERVFEGPLVKLDRRDKASIALILWSDGPDGRPLVAEFSFRCKAPKSDDAEAVERFDPGVARCAMEWFELLQRHDACRPDGMTKTQYVYRTSSPAAGD